MTRKRPSTARPKPTAAAPAEQQPAHTDPAALASLNARLDQPLPELDPLSADNSGDTTVKHMMAPGHLPPRPLPGSVTRYVSRIRIIDAWQYRGTLRDAPDFIDRSWAAWDDTVSPAGPALRVPGDRDEPKICRGGDYVVRQLVTLIDGVPADERVEVWGREEFERLFMPTRRSSDDTDLEDVPRQAPPVMEEA